MTSPEKNLILLGAATAVLGTWTNAAKVFGVHRTTLLRWRNGAPIPDSAVTIARAVIRHPEDYGPADRLADGS